MFATTPASRHLAGSVDTFQIGEVEHATVQAL